MVSNQLPQKVLFHRNFKRFSGGHLKVWHYYSHLKGSNDFTPVCYFSEKSIWNDDNPWLALKEQREKFWSPQNADILFLAGKDWILLKETAPPSHRTPVVNLIQHVRHADPADVRFSFLSNRAVRICVSEQITQCLRETRRINGPLFTVSNGIDLDELPISNKWTQRSIDILIAGLKNPVLAMELAERLSQRISAVEVLTTHLPRRQFLEKLNQSKTVILLPNRTEGFFLPALEAMAVGAMVVCPDCIGNRSFCIDGSNCFMPDYTLPDIVQAAVKSFSLGASDRQRLLNGARKTLLQHSLIREKKEFIEIMTNLGHIW
jgi:hypothetical protein